MTVKPTAPTTGGRSIGARSRRSLLAAAQRDAEPDGGLSSYDAGLAGRYLSRLPRHAAAAAASAVAVKRRTRRSAAAASTSRDSGGILSARRSSPSNAAVR